MELASENIKKPGNLPKAEESPKRQVLLVPKGKPVTTKKALEFLLAGTLKHKVCRYCLNVTFPLSELDQILHIASKNAIYDVTIRNVVSSVHPIKVNDDPNLPNKICNKCLDRAINSYLFAQQCEQSERALYNCLEDMFEKLEKLDPIERTKKRGRQKLNPNYNILYTEHINVIDYAEPVWQIINCGSDSHSNEPVMSDLECKKCWQVLPNVESLVNHEKSHPKSMWFNCRVCGQSFPKLNLFRKHSRIHERKAKIVLEAPPESNTFECKLCAYTSENYLVHLQHIETHKFKTVMEHLVRNDIHRLCAVCLDKGPLTDIDKVISLHGGCPELTGERNLYSILGCTIPEMNTLPNYTGTKICEKCLDSAISSYVFINRTQYVRNRLNRCITQMVENLAEVNTDSKLFIEISHNGILPVVEDDYIDDLLMEDTEIDETKLKVDVLEDEFRIKSDSEESSDTENANNNENTSISFSNPVAAKTDFPKLLNGFQPTDHSHKVDVCSEFLTFKKRLPPSTKSKAYRCRYKCSICNKSFMSVDFLKTHFLKHTNKRVQCKICNYEFKSKFHLYEHTRITHLLQQPWYMSCESCGRIYTDESKLLKHKKCHEAKQCELCTKVFITQRCFDNHLRRHALNFKQSKEPSGQSCSFCEKEYPNYKELALHVNKIHLQIKPYGCDMCSRLFYTESMLNNHKKIHTLPRKEKCQICNKKLKCRRDLVVHVRKHLGDKPFKCLICFQTFYSEFKMKTHMKRWHGGCYCCKWCKKVFVNKNRLKTHKDKVQCFSLDDD